MKDNAIEISIKDVLKCLARRWWIILLVTVAFAVGFFALENYTYVPSYSATVKMYVNNDSLNLGATKVSLSYTDITASQQLVYTYCEILETNETYKKVKSYLPNGGKDLSVDFSYDDFTHMIESGSLNDTEVFYIKVTCQGVKADRYTKGTPKAASDALAIAEATMQALVDRIEVVIQSTSASKVDGAFRAVPSRCEDVKSGVIGAIFGFILSAGVCILLDVFINDRIQDEDWITATFNDKLSVLSVVPNGFNVSGKKYGYYGKYGRYGKYGKYGQSPVLDDVDDYTDETDESIITKVNYVATEAYNVLRTNVFYSLPEKDNGKVVGVTSASPGDGKTFTSINLAYAMAREGNKVLLVECDMRKPNIAKVLGIKNAVGLSDYLVGRAKDIINKGVITNTLDVLAAGTIPPNPSELLASNKMQECINEMCEKYDYIILDAPPVLAVADPLVIAKYADAMIVVARHYTTRKKYLLSAVKQLNMTKVKILGFVYNDFRVNGGKYYKNEKYYYKYRYQSDKADTKN